MLIPCFRSPARLLAALLAATVLGGCAGYKTTLPPGQQEPDKVLFERGTQALNGKKWATAREYYRQIVEGYPQSPYRADAKLGVGDTYLIEGTTASYVLAVNEFKEFLTFFPTHQRADYAQFKLAMSYYQQMAKPERDQSNTKEALKEFDFFFERFPNSALAEEVRSKQRQARDRLSRSEYGVGLFYFRSRWYPGAVDRLQSLLKTDPGYTNRDAVYFYLAESLAKLGREAEALPVMERIEAEFTQSEYLEKAKLRVAELKATVPAAQPTEPKQSAAEK